MVWDCLIGLVVVLFTLVGWSVGLLRSWSVPFSMLIATFVAQHIYVDLATILVETLHLEPTFAVFASYFSTWLALAQYCDTVLPRLTIKLLDKPPNLLLKMGGGAVGFAKGLGAFVLTAMVTFAHNKVPEPPVLAWENNWIIDSAADSFFLPRLHLLASKLDEPLGKFVLSDSAPRFRPNFTLGDDPLAAVEKSEEKRGYEFVQSWKKFQKDMGQD